MAKVNKQEYICNTELDKSFKKEVIFTLKKLYHKACNSEELFTVDEIEENLRELKNGVVNSDVDIVKEVLFDCIYKVANTQNVSDGYSNMVVFSDIIYLNKEDMVCEELIDRAINSLNKDSFIDCLGYLEDLCYQLKLDVCGYLTKRLED